MATGLAKVYCGVGSLLYRYGRVDMLSAPLPMQTSNFRCPTRPPLQTECSLCLTS